ncbi:GNAT family N-acetyltransferase [Vibrio sp. SM6]|uniref:GNAT family N-acetyltransferase n=1 Tax=Vibrio agarilyticus TaxID=2726741 RepID=A0A7X8YG54_9VIBR|nr:GNAT family N-acetyltransferase [Vibrio agarilyticus]NLS12608.1 GNAT family N-acetyltransferase [Vibrio agarilyticus]
MIIQAAQYSDLETLNQLMFDLHEEHHLQAPDQFKTAQEIEQEKSIARYLDDPECLVFVAREGDHIIGFITGHFCELVSTVSKAVLMGSVDELYVEPRFRQKGVAQALFHKIESRFIGYGVKQIFVEVWAFNQTAQQFYQQQGFGHHIHWLRKPVD